jgi:glycosyltransferase involved in cell wall biosynthesis
VKPELRRIAVVVPAHNEEALIPACLAALRDAANLVSLPVRILVVLDDCTDRTADVCGSFGVETCRISARNVGLARAVGARTLLANETAPESVWLATTDADTRVESTWLRHQVELARSGADVVLGIVQLGDDVPPGQLRRTFEANYRKRLSRDGTHQHVHGANLGLRAGVYLRAGGFAPIATHEDHRLLQQLHSMEDITIEAPQSLRVRTSGRTNARSDQGFGTHLKWIETQPRTGPGPGLATRSP